MFEESPLFGFQSFESQPIAPQPSFSRIVRSLAIVLVLGALLAPAAFAQRTRTERRETSAIRKARIERAIKDTYTHRWEVAGGGGYLRFRSGQYTQKNSEIAFFMNGTYYFNEKLGLTGEIRGAYGNAKVGNTIYNIANPQISEYPMLFGPTYRVYTKEKFAISPFVLAGTAIGKFDDGAKGLTATEIGLWPSTSARPAFSGGANLDLNLYPNIAFRIAPSYTATTFGSTLQNNFGFNMGVVFRFGRQK